MTVATLVTACGDGDDVAEPRTSSSTSIPVADCTDYLVVTVRGTGEPLADSNLLSPIAEQIGEEHAVRHYDVPYPASAEALTVEPGSAHFGASADEGVRMVLEQLEAGARDCPQQKAVVMGFSQGALVVGDALSSPSVRDAGPNEPQLSAAATESVAAAVLYGDPRFLGSEPFNAGTYDRGLNGMMQPRPAGALSAFDGRLRSYCVVKDFVCQAGGLFDPHLDYFDNGMRPEGADFVLGELGS